MLVRALQIVFGLPLLASGVGVSAGSPAGPVGWRIGVVLVLVGAAGLLAGAFPERKADAHDADSLAHLTVGHPERDRILEIEVDRLLRAYLAGFAGGRGRMEASRAEGAAASLGDACRRGLTDLGVTLEDVRRGPDPAVHEALLAIARRGGEDAS